MAQPLKLTWDGQLGDVIVTTSGGVMLYSNDGGSILQKIQPGVNTLAVGTGPYSLEEEVSCTVTKCGFNDLVSAPNLTGNMRVEFGSLETANQMFHNCSGLGTLDVSNLETSSITDTMSMFYNCKVTTIDVSNWNTNLVTNMKNMFNECSNLATLDLLNTAVSINAVSNNFNTSNVTTMLGMFAGCSSLTTLDLTDFDTSKVANMSAMFSGCSGLTEVDVSMFNTSAVTISTQMFSGCSSLTGLDLSSFDTNQINAMTNMFYGCSSLTCISNLNTLGAVNGRGGIFTGCTSLISPDANAQLLLTKPSVGGGGFGWSGVGVCPPPVLPLTINWDSQADDTSVTIENANMEYTNNGGATWSTLAPGNHKLPTGGGSYTLRELANGSVTRCAFNDPSCSSNFNGTMEAFGGAILSAESMFFECNSLTALDVTGLNTEYCSDAANMFSNCGGLSTLDVSTFDTERFATTAGMFNGCSGLTTLDLSNFDTSVVTDTSSMFAGCTLLTTLDVSSFDTSSVVDTSYMFWGCSSIKIIDISSFDASVVLNTTQMFSQCCSITHLDLSSFDTQNVVDMKAMFYRSNNLICITNLDTTAANNPGGRDNLFTGCDALVDPDSTLGQPDLTDLSGARWVNANPCSNIVSTIPSTITDFSASDGNPGTITFTWSDSIGVPTPTYDLYNAFGLVQSNVTSGVTINIFGAETYYVKAINTEGETNSNTDTGEATNTDVTPPVITLLGTTPITIAQFDLYTDAGAEANDNVDGNITTSIVTLNQVDSSIIGSYIVTYNVSDAAGNQAVEVVRTVVVEDFTPPIVALRGTTTVLIDYGNDYVEAGAIATDDTDGVVTLDIVIDYDGLVFTKPIPGTYSVIYTAPDSSGNVSVPVIRTVIVTDVTPPVITLVGAEFMLLLTTDTYTESGATATDDYDPPPAVVIGGDVVDTTTVGTYVVTYYAEDTAGNSSTITRTVTVNAP